MSKIKLQKSLTNKFDLKQVINFHLLKIIIPTTDMTSSKDNKLNQTVLQKQKEPKQIGDFIIGKTLGEGTFGKVRLATHKHTQQKVAIKFLQKKKISQVADVQRVTRQIHILKLIRHPNLVQLYQIIQTPKQLLLIMEFMQNGQLFDYIVKNKRIKEDEARKLFHQIIDGIEYIHKIGVAHRDLKPENILLSYNGSLKIVDFGLSNTYKKNQSLKTPCGSPCYAAPEMIQGERYDGLKVDIWSSGIILFAMINGYLPFEDEDTNLLYKKVLSGNYDLHHSVSEQGRDLIKRILNNKPNERYTIQQIRSHPWMQKYKGKKLNQGIVVGYNKIPVDKEILKGLSKYNNSSYDLDYVQTCIQANRHNQVTVTYYLAMKKYLKQGGVSRYNLGDENFDNALIQPTKRKQHSTAETLIDNFFTKSSYGGSTDITQHNEKRKTSNRLSAKDKQQNKENISVLMNKKRSKDNKEKRSKEKSRDNILKLREQGQSSVMNTSHMLGSVGNAGRNSKLNQSIDKRSQSQVKRVRVGSSTSKIQRKPRPQTQAQTTKLDTSINYGRVPLQLTKSIQKSSGRQSQQPQSRQSMIQNRVTRKYKQQFNQSLISKSKGKLKTQRERQRSRVNSTSINQSISQNTYQGFNTTVINTTSGHALMNLSKKYKQHDNSNGGYIEEYLMKGKKVVKKCVMSSNLSNVKQLSTDSSKIIKARKL